MRDRLKEALYDYSLPCYDSVISGTRPLRTRMRGGVGAGGLKPPATRFDANGENIYGAISFTVGKYD